VALVGLQECCVCFNLRLLYHGFLDIFLCFQPFDEGIHAVCLQAIQGSKLFEKAFTILCNLFAQTKLKFVEILKLSRLGIGNQCGKEQTAHVSRGVFGKVQVKISIMIIMMMKARMGVCHRHISGMAFS
jgi:hypothetical protein